MQTKEHFVAELIEALKTDSRRPAAGQAEAVVAPSLFADWGDQHEAAAREALRITLESADPRTGPIACIVLGLADFISAFMPGNPELLLDPAPARISVVGEDVRIGLLTPVTKVDDLLVRLLGRVPARPRYRAEPVRVRATLDAKLGAQELAEYLQLTPREGAQLYRERPTPGQIDRILDALISRLATEAPLLAEVLSSVRTVDPQGLREFPFVVLILAVLRGVRPPGERGRVNLAQLVKLPNGTELALAIVPSALRRDPVLRRDFAAYMRHLADRRIAPWLQWNDRRKRREALTLYARRLAGLRPDIRHVALTLRARHANEYVEEADSVTVSRLERISATLSDTTAPRRLRHKRK